jgi:hypothetical protein
MEIKISKSNRNCGKCERPFVHEEELISLVRMEGQALIREDYCRSCWREEWATQAFSAWTHRYYDPQVAEQQPPEVFSPLRQVFYEAVEAQTRFELAKAYLAAQLLRRQKVFRLIKESAEEQEGAAHVALFADRIGNRLIEVRDPNLSFDELEVGRQALLERLGELENGGVGLVKESQHG